ncbi:MAG: hypothetical protein RI964_2345 [Pseudomonadota bacterium]|jgi:hypothetical protein
MSRKRFTDYPTSFWFAVLATITAAILAISSYSRMINDDVATMKAAMIVISFEGALIVAMAVMNGRLQGLLKGWAFVLLFLLAMAEIFMASMEIQHGIAEAGANAENYQQSANNLGTVAAGMADATKALADCDKRFARKKKDADARAQCRKPYEKIVAASAGAMPSGGNNAPKYDEENAGKLSQWQAVADVLNTTWQPEKPITWGQAAFYVMTAIMALFIMVKNFLWAKYAHGDELTAYLANQQAVNVPERAIGSAATVAEAVTPTATDTQTDEPAQPAKHGFGFVPTGKRVESSADRNRALHERVNTRTCNNTHDSLHERVNTRTCNNTHDPLHKRVGNSSGKSTNYDSATSAKVGSMIDCPQCGTTFRKANKWHTFCCSSCKDNWHNERDPSRLEALKAIKRRKSA